MAETNSESRVNSSTQLALCGLSYYRRSSLLWIDRAKQVQSIRYARIVFFTIMLAAFGVANPRYSYAAPVYKSEDKDGRIVYSSKPPTKDAKPAQLPEIMRGDLLINKITRKTCTSRGGVNCEAGADSDGSVICFDGSNDSDERFSFTCTTPKLEITEITEITPEGRFSVFIRNNKGVKAKAPVVSYKLPNGSAVELRGPAEIAPFELGEFAVATPDPTLADKQPTATQIEITCSNC